MELFTIKTNNKEELVDITVEVEKRVRGKSGICFVFIKHATAGIFVNENEFGLKYDFLKLFSDLIPEKNWKHNKVDDNATSHMKASLIGQFLFVPVKEGMLIKGTWQNIFLAEFDGPREREIIVDVR